MGLSARRDPLGLGTPGILLGLFCVGFSVGWTLADRGYCGTPESGVGHSGILWDFVPGSLWFGHSRTSLQGFSVGLGTPGTEETSNGPCKCIEGRTSPYCKSTFYVAQCAELPAASRLAAAFELTVGRELDSREARKVPTRNFFVSSA